MHERDDCQQVSRPKQGSTGRHDDKRINRSQVRPTRRHRVQVRHCVLERHPVFAPGLLPRQETQPLPAAWVKRMGDLNP